MELSNRSGLLPMSINEKRRALDVYYTDNGTKLFVENGILVEERIHVSHPNYPPNSSFFHNRPLAYSSSAFVCKPYTAPPELIAKYGLSYKIDPDLWASAYSSSSPVYKPRISPQEAEIQKRDQNMRTSKAALEYYNKKHHTTYVLVDAIDSGGNLWASGLWYHCNFTAKSVGDLSTKLFFAELKVTNKSVNNYQVTACRILQDNKIRKECEMCGGGSLLHPTHGFRQGLHKFMRRNLRPRRNK